VTLWWLGNAVLIAVVVPVVIVLLEGVRKPALKIKRHADRIAEHSRSLPAGAEPIQGLTLTLELVEELSGGLERYGVAVAGLAPGGPPDGGHRTDWSGTGPGESPDRSHGPPDGGHRTDWSGTGPGEPPDRSHGHRTDWSGTAPGESPGGGHRTDWSDRGR